MASRHDLAANLAAIGDRSSHAGYWTCRFGPLARRLNTLALGEEYATHLGVSVQKTRIAVIVIGSILTGAAVALGGLIGFTGLIIPHILRMMLGPDHVRLLPATALAGALFLLVADTVGAHRNRSFGDAGGRTNCFYRRAFFSLFVAEGKAGGDDMMPLIEFSHVGFAYGEGKRRRRTQCASLLERVHRRGGPERSR